ncbi:hypothetical protein [Microvirga calopogonii]|uniref:hypothetical protein n=1 Tax=Microvirga calopogonii TaxID=2078013 RepID=UPI0013B36430|nr:hypothetical protein [Microvirga calopogonii]
MNTPHAAANTMAYVLTTALMHGVRQVCANNEARAEAAAYDAWDSALSSARGSADAMTDVACAAIQRVAELEAQVAQLHRAIRYRDEALAARQ